MEKLNKLTPWVTVFALCIGMFLFSAAGAAEEQTVAAMDPIPDGVVISKELSIATDYAGLGSSEGEGGAAGPAIEKSLMPKEVKHDLFEGVGEEVDTRIISISYWLEMADPCALANRRLCWLRREDCSGSTWLLVLPRRRAKA